ncbi:MAG TPA: TadE/TadG family type IV pilus assembly protein [Alphaproteobacteria bacterium]|nr:TadE/TadG family type IV pilus assembly protein [Alphaproteobacteria bacterium]
MHNRFKRMNLTADCSGNMAVEFALLLPAVLILLGGLIEFGSAMHASSSLESAARAGAQYAFEKGLDKPGIEQAVKNASTYPPAKLTVASSMACECDGAAASCTVDCASGYVPFKFITVQVSAANDPWFPVIEDLVPVTFSGSAVVQVP